MAALPRFPLSSPGAFASPVLRAAAVALLSVVLLAAPGRAAWAERYAAIVMDAHTGAILHQDNADDRRFPASLTKMMTLYMAFEALDAGRLSLEQRLPVSEAAQAMPATKLGVRAGQTLRVEHAILALVTKSANDASVVLAEAMGGSEGRFAQMMTQRARQLGMRSTTFRNASGLPDDGQVSTARDLAILSRALLHDHPRYYHYFSSRTFNFGGSVLRNHNRLMSRFDGMDGIKTGYIRASGFNLAASAVRGNRRLIAVVMGGQTARARDDRMAVLLENAFARLGGQPAPQVALLNPPLIPAPSVAPAQTRAARSGIPVPGRKPGAAAATSVGPAVAGAAMAGLIRELEAAKAEPASSIGVGDATAGWAVQVGAFKSRRSSEQAIAKASSKARSLLSQAQPRVVPVPTREGTVYRARFFGLEEDSARAVCSQLQRAGHRCLALPPSETL